MLLEAAARVLREVGPLRFNTNRVAEKAGVSVGTLYQYYPNKAALLLRLHEFESRDTMGGVAAILTSGSGSARERVLEATRAFFRTEAAEAPLRGALALVELDFRKSEGFAATEAAILDVFLEFLAAEGCTATLWDARVALAVVTAVSEQVTARGVDDDELMRWADECGAMVCERLGIRG